MDFGDLGIYQFFNPAMSYKKKTIFSSNDRWRENSFFFVWIAFGQMKIFNELSKYNSNDGLVL